MTCFTAIFGEYDYLKPMQREQRGDWKFVCFTDQPPESSVFEFHRLTPGWDIVRVPVMDCGPQKTARYYKIMAHEVIDDDVTLWIDGTFFVNCSLQRWMRKRFSPPMTAVQHPFDNCIYTDIVSCIRSKRGDPDELIRQYNYYKEVGVPVNNGLISSGVLMRKRNPGVTALCETWWDQVRQWSARDQIAFGYAAWKHPGVFNTIQWDYTTQKEFEHCPHRHKPWAEDKARKMAGL